MPRSRDRSTAGTGKRIRLSCSAIQRQPSYPFAAVEKPALILFFAHLTACLINLVAGWRAIRVDPRNVGARMLLAAALLGLGLTHQAAQRLDSTHVLFAAVVSLGLAPLSLFILLPQSSIGLAGRGGARRLCACPFLVLQRERSFPLKSIGQPRATRKMKNRRPRNNASLSGHSIFVVPTTTILLSIISCSNCARPLISGNRPGSRLPADIGRADWLVLDRSFACLERTKCVQRVRLGCIKPNGAISI